MDLTPSALPPRPCEPTQLPTASPAIPQPEDMPYVKVPLNFPVPPPAPDITFGVEDLDLKSRKSLPDDWGFSFSGTNVCVKPSDISTHTHPSTKHCAHACILVGNCQGFLVVYHLPNDPCYLVNPEMTQECNGT